MDSKDTPAVEDAGGAAGGGSAGTSLSGGSARNTHPSPTRPGRDSEKDADEASPQAPPPNWFDTSDLGGFLGVDAGNPPTPAGATAGSTPLELASALPGRDSSSSPSSAVLLAASLLILVALTGGAAFRWWDQRPDRYWSA